MPIETKTLGMLVDELCTTSQKLFRLQDEIVATRDDSEAGRKAKQLQTLNRRRSELIGAIDRMTGDDSASPTAKTYH